MRINLYFTDCDPKCVHKKLIIVTGITEYPNIIQPVDIKNPELIMGHYTPFVGQYEQLKESVDLQYNYVSIFFTDTINIQGWDQGSMGRLYGRYFYYFVDSFTLDKQGLVHVKLKIDLLMTYEDIIYKSISRGYGIITRGSNISTEEKLLPDPKVQFGARSAKDQTVLRFPSNALTWDNPYFLLAVAGSYGVFSDTESNNSNGNVELGNNPFGAM